MIIFISSFNQYFKIIIIELLVGEELLIQREEFKIILQILHFKFFIQKKKKMKFNKKNLLNVIQVCKPLILISK